LRKDELARVHASPQQMRSAEGALGVTANVGKSLMLIYKLIRNI
jgi:hypothetical protein